MPPVQEPSMPVADQGPLSGLPLADYRPYSRLRLPQTTVTHASVPAVDAHTHLGRWVTGERWAVPDVAAFVGLMDSCHISRHGQPRRPVGRRAGGNLDRYDRSHPGRFATFCHVDWDLLREPDAEDEAGREPRTVGVGGRPRPEGVEGPRPGCPGRRRPDGPGRRPEAGARCGPPRAGSASLSPSTPPTRWRSSTRSTSATSASRNCWPAPTGLSTTPSTRGSTA